MKLYLHVGPHKTGTTLIQKTMLDNQGLLLQQGVFFILKTLSQYLATTILETKFKMKQ